jgi:hypothetical protein
MSIQDLIDKIMNDESEVLILDTLSGFGNVRPMGSNEFLEDGFVWAVNNSGNRVCVGRELKWSRP